MTCFSDRPFEGQRLECGNYVNTFLRELGIQCHRMCLLLEDQDLNDFDIFLSCQCRKVLSRYWFTPQQYIHQDF